MHLTKLAVLVILLKYYHNWPQSAKLMAAARPLREVTLSVASVCPSVSLSVCMSGLIIDKRH